METFEHSKAMQAKVRRERFLREAKICGIALIAGGAVFFINGGLSSLVWASFSGCFIAALVGFIAEYYLDGQ